MTPENDILEADIDSKGFGKIAKLVMTDKRLTIQAKAIYSYFCSYAGSGRTAFPRMTKVIDDLCISKDCYYKHLNLLKEHGYIKVQQERNKGRFTCNLYVLMSTLPIPLKSETKKPETRTVYNKQSFKMNSKSEREPARVAEQTAAYGEFMKVNLTEQQYNDLVECFGYEKAIDYINRVDLHIASTDQTYPNHYATIKKWFYQDKAKTESSRQQPIQQQDYNKPKPNRFCNFPQRNWDYADILQNERELLTQGQN